MKVVIAEKPSVAREIAVLLGATEKKDGYLTGTGYCVTWAFGHLVSLAMPEDYGVTGFKKETLPIIPNPFLLTVRKIRKNKDYVIDPGAQKQLKTIEQLLKKCESIIVATDAGREGELIFRYIYEYLDCSKPFERLWISSLTERAILEGLKNLKPGHEFDGLHQAGLGRSQADWLVGINASQALTIAAGHGVYSLGRVQTPTLALICKRFLEHKYFKVKNYWQIELQHRKEFIDFKSVSNSKWDNKKHADDILKSIQRQGYVTVDTIDIKTVNEQPPLLFDLTALQKEANKKLNFSAEETLNLAQNLYEKKFITYPRTGSKYIPEDMWAEIPKLIRVLDGSVRFKETVSKMKWGRFNKRIVNDLKVTDHHGLLITDKGPSALSAKENSIYEMIAFRLLESVSQICIKEITDISLQAIHYDFTLKGCKVLEGGWRAIKGNFSDDENEIIQAIPDLKIGEEIKIHEAKVLEKKTKAPALFTEASLLSAMESAGKQVDNAEERKVLQTIGIGTPATRAAIIETLFKREYIVRDKKALLPTEKGLHVYDLVKDKKIADVSMTAEWELALQKIENNEENLTEFQKNMESFTGNIITEILSTKISMANYPELLCPKCKAHNLLIREKIVKCPSETCNWIQFRNVCDVHLQVGDIELLINKGKTSLIKGMKSKSGKKFDAYIVLNEKADTSFEFPKIPGKKKIGK